MDFLEFPIISINYFELCFLYWVEILGVAGELDVCMIDYFTFINCVNYEEVFNELIFDQIFVIEVLLKIENCDLLVNKIYMSSAISNAYYLCYNRFEWDTGFLFRFQVFGAGLIYDWDYFYDVWIANEECYAFCWPCITYFEYFLTTASSFVFQEEYWINATSLRNINFTIPSDYQISFYYVLLDSKFYIYMNLLLFANIIDIFLMSINCFLYLLIYIIEIISYVLIIFDLQYIINILCFIKEYKEIFNEFDYNIYVYNYKHIDMGFYIYFLFISIINSIVILFILKLFFYCLKLALNSNLNKVNYLVNIKFIIGYTITLLYKNYKYYLIYYPNVIKINIPNNIFGVFNYTWYKIQKKIEYILFNNKNKIFEYILFLYRNQKGFGISFIGYISNILIYCQMFSYLFFKELAFKWKVEIKYFTYAKDKQIKLNKTTKILLPSIWILDSYFRCYLNQIFIRYYKIILFSIQFSVKFFIYKIFKFILKLFLDSKILHIIIYYVIIFNVCVKKVSKILYNKLFWYIYLKIKIYKIYYINMYLHFYIYKIITQFFFYDAYYINVEMADKYPYYQSKLLVNFFNFIVPFNKCTNNYLISFLFILYNLVILCFFKIINLSLYILKKFIRYIYYILLIKLNILFFFIKKLILYIY